MGLAFFLLGNHRFFRVRKAPIPAAARAAGARRMKAYSKAWKAAPNTAVSGSE